MRTVTVLDSNFTSKRLQQLAFTFSHQKKDLVQNSLLSYLENSILKINFHPIKNNELDRKWLQVNHAKNHS